MKINEKGRIMYFFIHLAKSLIGGSIERWNYKMTLIWDGSVWSWSHQSKVKPTHHMFQFNK